MPVAFPLFLPRADALARGLQNIDPGAYTVLKDRFGDDDSHKKRRILVHYLLTKTNSHPGANNPQPGQHAWVTTGISVDGGRNAVIVRYGATQFGCTCTTVDEAEQDVSALKNAPAAMTLLHAML